MDVEDIKAVFAEAESEMKDANKELLKDFVKDLLKEYDMAKRIVDKIEGQINDVKEGNFDFDELVFG